MSRLALLCCVLVVCSCSSPPQPAGTVKQYSLSGSVVRLNERSHVATIKHGPIKGASGETWMEPMTMDFPVRDKDEFSRLKPGQQIRATVHQRESDYEYWLSSIQVQPPPGSTGPK